jgi:hypothetical protein
MRLVALVVIMSFPVVVFAGEREAKIYKTPSVAKKLVEKIDFCNDPLYQALFQRVEITTEVSTTKTPSTNESKPKPKDKTLKARSATPVLRLTAYDVICGGVL